MNTLARHTQFAAIVLMTAAMQMVASAEVVGIVVDGIGTWCDQAHQTCTAGFEGLPRMYHVQQDSKLVRVAPFNGTELLSVRSRTGDLETFDCSQPRELGCNTPLNLDRLNVKETKPTVVSAFISAVIQLASARPRVYDALRQGLLRTRGASDPLVTDGVAELKAGTLDLRNILGGSNAENYLLELCPISNDSGQPQCPAAPDAVQYSWSPRNITAFPAKNSRPGLYRLYFCETSLGITVRTSTYADVLIAEAPRFEQLAADFQRVTDATRDWDASDRTAGSLRRAYLYALAGQ